MIRVVLVLTLSLAFGGAIAQPQATPSLRTINLVTFAGGFNLPTFVAQRQGFFTKHGVDVNLRYTPNSVYLITGLVEGRFDITTSAIDNLVAYQEGQGEAPLKVQPDLVAFLGFDDANLNLVALPEVKSIGDLRGKDLGVDALTTGFAFVLREMVEKAGMKDSDVKYDCLIANSAPRCSPLRSTCRLNRRDSPGLATRPIYWAHIRDAPHLACEDGSRTTKRR